MGTVTRAGLSVDSGIVVLDRAMAVVAAVDRGASTLRALTVANGLPRSTVHRMAQGLERHGLLRFERGRGYRLGPRWHRLGLRAAQDLPLADVARPILERLTDATGESSQLYVRLDDSRLCVAAVDSPNELRTIVRVGAELPLTKGSAGKVFVSAAVGSDREALLRRADDRARMERQIASIRRSGWAQSAGEREPGVGSVSAPVFGLGDTIAAVVSVSGPEARMRGLHARRYAPAVMAAARDLERALGATDQAPGR